MKKPNVAGLPSKKRTPISATRVGVRESAHTFCVVYKRNSPHTYVWAKQLAPTRLFFSLLIPVTCVRVGEVDNAHTPVCQASYLLVPHATCDGHRAPAVAMVQTLVHIGLIAVAMSLNYGCHVGQLQLPCMVWSNVVAMISKF